MSILKAYQREDDGSVLVESALILPLLIAAGLGSIDASYMMLQNHKLESQLAMAASYLSRSDNPSNLENTAKTLALTGTIDGSKAVLKGWGLDDISISYLTTDNQTNGNGGTLYRGDATVTTVVISSQFDYKGMGILSSVIPNGTSLNASVEERVTGGGL